MKYAWITCHRACWPVSLACEVLGVSASGYFEHMRRRAAGEPSKAGANRRLSDEALLVHIKAIYAEVKGEYGWPRMCKKLIARDVRVGKERARKLMQRHGIKARGKREIRRHNRQPARPSGCTKSAGAGLQAPTAQPGVDKRHHLHRDRRRLGVSERGH